MSELTHHVGIEPDVPAAVALGLMAERPKCCKIPGLLLHARGVKHRDHGVVARRWGGMFLEEAVLLARWGNHRDAYRDVAIVVDEVTHVSDLAIDGTHVIVQSDVLHRCGVVGGVHHLGLVVGLDGGHLLHRRAQLLHCVAQFVRLVDERDGEVAVGLLTCEVDNKALVSGWHARRDRYVGNANLVHMIAAPDVLACERKLLCLLGYLLRCVGLLLHGVKLPASCGGKAKNQQDCCIANKESGEGARCRRCAKGDGHALARLDALEFLLMRGIALVYLPLIAALFRNDSFGCGTVVVEQDSSLVLVDIVRLGKDLASHECLLGSGRGFLAEYGLALCDEPFGLEPHLTCLRNCLRANVAGLGELQHHVEVRGNAVLERYRSGVAYGREVAKVFGNRCGDFCQLGRARYVESRKLRSAKPELVS